MCGSWPPTSGRHENYCSVGCGTRGLSRARHGSGPAPHRGAGPGPSPALRLLLALELHLPFVVALALTASVATAIPETLSLPALETRLAAFLLTVIFTLTTGPAGFGFGSGFGLDSVRVRTGRRRARVLERHRRDSPAVERARERDRPRNGKGPAPRSRHRPGLRDGCLGSARQSQRHLPRGARAGLGDRRELARPAQRLDGGGAQPDGHRGLLARRDRELRRADRLLLSRPQDQGPGALRRRRGGAGELDLRLALLDRRLLRDPDDDHARLGPGVGRRVRRGRGVGRLRAGVLAP